MNEHKEILHNAYLAAQEGLISALMLLPDRIIDVMSMINDDDFDNIACRYIFDAMRQMAENGQSKNISVGTLQMELEAQGHLATIGGQRKIISLYERGTIAASSATIDTYARTVKDIASKNRTKALIADMQASLSADSGVSARTVLETAQHDFTDVIGNLENVNTTTTVKDYYPTFVDNLKQRKHTYDTTGDALAASRGVSTGFSTLDRLTNGWRSGNMITVAAKTGVGKTTAAINFALAAAESNASVLFFSMEMNIEEIMTKLVSCYTGIPISSIQKGKINDDQVAEIEQATKLINMKIKIDTSENSTIDYIVSVAQKTAESDAGLDMVVVDYIGLIKYKGKFGSDRQNQIAEISRSLKETAKRLEVPIIVLVQINSRAVGEEAEQEPTMAMIRESNAIANDSNVVLIIHRKKRQPGEKNDEPTKFIVAKNRMGSGMGSFLCHSYLWKSKFEEIQANGNGEFDAGGDGMGADGRQSPIDNDTPPSNSISEAPDGGFDSVDDDDGSSDINALFGDDE